MGYEYVGISSSLPRALIKVVKRESAKRSLSLEKYIAKLVLQGLDPRDRALKYIDVAKELLEDARKELEVGNVRQVTKKAWGSNRFSNQGLRIVKGKGDYRAIEALGERGERPWGMGLRLVDDS